MFLVPECIDGADNEKQIKKPLLDNVLIIKLSSRRCVKVHFVDFVKKKN